MMVCPDCGAFTRTGNGWRVTLGGGKTTCRCPCCGRIADENDWKKGVEEA